MSTLSRLHQRTAHACALICALVLVCHCAVAQTGFASISGRVADHSGAVIQKADVSLKNLDTGIVLASQTNDDGIYNFPSVQPGNYVMHVQKPGFRSVDVTGLTLYTQDQLARNFALEVGSTSESITVTANTTSDSPAVSMTVDREFVENMPLNGRSFQDLIQLAPGAVSSETGYYSVDGQRTDSNNFTVDGVSANLGGYENYSSGQVASALAGVSPERTATGTTQSLVSVDALQEFTIQTSSYSAEFGRNPGGQVQFTTRSGTNDIHGTLFDYLRNTVFDANSFQNDLNKRAKTAEHQNDFGGTVGGPLVVPHFYNGRDRTFYFASYEGLRLLLPSSENEYVPTQALRSAASPAVQPFLNAKPIANNPNNVDSCTTTGMVGGPPCDALFYEGFSYPENIDNLSLRIDHKFGTRVSVFARYADTPTFSNSLGENPYRFSTNVHTWTGGLTYSVSSNLLNDFRVNLSYDGEQGVYSVAPFGGSTPFPIDLVIPAAYAGPYSGAYIPIQVSGSSLNFHFSVGGTGTVQHQFQIVDGFNWTRQKHSIKFGADWRRLTPTWVADPYDDTLELESLPAIENGIATSVQTAAQAPGKPVLDNLSLYIQDHFKATARLSLDYGLRWEFNPAPGPSNGEYPVALTTNNLTIAQLAPVGTPPYQTNHHSFAPRFGFAWTALPSVNHPLTLRGGFGIFFDQGQSAATEPYTGAYPFYATGPVQTNVPMPLSTTVLMPPSLNSPLTTPYPHLQLTSPYLTLPYTEQWSLSVDEALNSKNTLTATYVGNNGRKLLFAHLYISVPGNPLFGNVTLVDNAAQSSYNAFQVQDVGRIARGLNLVGSFTWGHALDNDSSDFGSEAPLYGNSDYDLRRMLNLALNYQAPAVSGNAILHAITQGWQLGNRFSTQSGYPITTITQATVTLPSGISEKYLPNLVPGVPIYLHGAAADLPSGLPTVGNWRLNPAAFACTPTSTGGHCTGTPLEQGNLGRNYVRNPPFWAWNTSLQRQFPIYERLSLNFRADAFNILNHPNLGSPYVASLTSSSFGLLQGAVTTTGTGTTNSLYAMGAPRSLQFSLHLQF